MVAFAVGRQAGEGRVGREGGEAFRGRPVSAPPSRRSPFKSGSAESASGVVGGQWPGKADKDAATGEIGGGGGLLGWGERRVGQEDQTGRVGDEVIHRAGDELRAHRECPAQVIERAEKRGFGIGAAGGETCECGVGAGIGEAVPPAVGGPSRIKRAILLAMGWGKVMTALPAASKETRARMSPLEGFGEQFGIGRVGNGAQPEAAVGCQRGRTEQGG